MTEPNPRRLKAFIVFDRPNEYGHTIFFRVDGNIYYADITSRVYPTETMIFPCSKDGGPDFGKELYVAYHDEPRREYLLEDITSFLLEGGMSI